MEYDAINTPGARASSLIFLAQVDCFDYVHIGLVGGMTSTCTTCLTGLDGCLPGLDGCLIGLDGCRTGMVAHRRLGRSGQTILRSEEKI